MVGNCYGVQYPQGSVLLIRSFIHLPDWATGIVRPQVTATSSSNTFSKYRSRVASTWLHEDLLRYTFCPSALWITHMLLPGQALPAACPTKDP